MLRPLVSFPDQCVYDLTVPLQLDGEHSRQSVDGEFLLGSCHLLTTERDVMSEKGRGGREGGRERRKREEGREEERGRKEGEGEREEGRDERMVGVCEGGEFELTRDKRICSLHLGGLILLTFAEP